MRTPSRTLADPAPAAPAADGEILRRLAGTAVARLHLGVAAVVLQDADAPYHVPVAWCKNYGDGRMFYNNLGHNNETWTNPTFLKSTEAGIRWCLGLVDGDATPNPEVSKAQEEKAKADAGN